MSNLIYSNDFRGQLFLFSLTFFLVGIFSASIFFIPIITCYLMAFFSFIRFSRTLDFFLGMLICFVFSMLVTSRPEWSGIEYGGFGSDIALYKLAFSELIDLKTFDIKEVFFISASQTGSTEPIFWSFTYLLTRLFSTPDLIWFSITFCSLGVLYYYFSLDTKFSPIPLLVIFCSTITFYIFLGSVIRQGVAFVLFYACIFEFYQGNLKKSYGFIFLAAMIHFSCFILFICLFFGERMKELSFKNYKKNSLYVALLFIFIFGCYFILPNLQFDSNLFDKIRTRINIGDYNNSHWEFQFFTEVAAFLMLQKFLRFKLPENLYMTFLILCVLVIMTIPLVGVADRLYRYTYVFYLFYYWFWMKNGNQTSQKLKLFIQNILVFVSFSWFCFLFLTRYDGLFMESDFMGVVSANLLELAVHLK